MSKIFCGLKGRRNLVQPSSAHSGRNIFELIYPGSLRLLPDRPWVLFQQPFRLRPNYLELVLLVESVIPDDVLPEDAASVLVMAEPEVTALESAGAGTTTGAGAGGGVSSFLPQAVDVYKRQG